MLLTDVIFFSLICHDRAISPLESDGVLIAIPVEPQNKYDVQEETIEKRQHHGLLRPSAGE